MPMLTCHVITGLNDGGAEAVLYRLCKHGKKARHCVISLSGTGKYGPLLEDIGVDVIALDMSPSRFPLLSFIRLVKLLRRYKPDVVQTWMYHGDLFGGLATRAAGIKSVVWGIRHTTLEPGKSKQTTIWISRILARLSWWLPAKIVVCSQRAMDVHEALGFDRSKMCFIPNGYDLMEFRPARDRLHDIKVVLASDQPIPLLGMVGRFNPQKDHSGLLEALAILRRREIEFQFLLVGTGLDSSNSLLIEWINYRGLADCVQLLGRRNDIPEIMNALDLHVLSSAFGEAFPNVVAEAMACGTPCIVTDVGDAGQIIGDTGWVVPPRNERALAHAIESAISEMYSSHIDWSRRCLRARQRIENNYSIEQMTSEYFDAWSTVCSLASKS